MLGMRTKSETRRRIRALRRSLQPHQLEAASLAVVERVLGLPCFAMGESIMAYLSLPTELSVDLLVRHCLRSRKQVSVPVTLLAEGRLEVVRVYGLDIGLVLGPMGIREPARHAGDIVEPSCIDIMVVPGVAFDEFGGRLGYGGGFYDRLWPKVRKDAVLVGVALEEQVVPELPMEAHDMRMDVLITPCRVLTFSGGC